MEFGWKDKLGFWCVEWEVPVGLSCQDAQRAAGNMGLRLRRECGQETQRSESSLCGWLLGLCVGEAIQEELEERDEQEENGA